MGACVCIIRRKPRTIHKLCILIFRLIRFSVCFFSYYHVVVVRSMEQEQIVLSLHHSTLKSKMKEEENYIGLASSRGIFL